MVGASAGAARTGAGGAIRSTWACKFAPFLQAHALLILLNVGQHWYIYRMRRFLACLMVSAATLLASASAPAEATHSDVAHAHPASSHRVVTFMSQAEYEQAARRGTAHYVAKFMRANPAGKAIPRVLPGDPGGYDGVAASRYADAWALSRNPSFPDFSANGGGGDCTNFVSQAMSAGGWVETGTSLQTDDTYWHFIHLGGSTGSYTRTWSAADNQWRYQTVTPYSIFEGKWQPGAGSYNSTYTPNAVKSGDVVLYNWFNNDNSATAQVHWAIQTGYGYSTGYGAPPRAIYGNYVDTHTNDHYHAFWSLWPYNTNKATTSYRFWHLT